MNGDRLPSSDDTGTDQVLGGRYRLISQVGAGGMAAVWQAYDSVLGRTVAVKVLAAQHAEDPQSRERIRQEARAAAALSHPNIAQVYDYGEADVAGEIVPYLVMELIRGDTPHQRLRDGPVLPRFAMRVCAEIAAALAAAHAEGLAHRDIKPANVMLAVTGAKVVDFGIAAAIRAPGTGADDFEVLGTPAYLAPERLLHDAVEPASDVYALGVLLYRLLTGHSPWTSETTTQMLTAHVYLEPAPLLSMVQVPPYVTALCNRCLVKNPAERPTAREAATLLAHGAGLQVITDEPAARERTSIDPEPSVLIRTVASADREPAGPNDGAFGPPPAERGPAPSQPADAAPAAGFSDPHLASTPPVKRRSRTAYGLAAAVLLAIVAATLWIRWPAHHDATEPAAAPSADGVDPSRTATRAPAKPRTSTGPVIAGPAPNSPGSTVAISTTTVYPALGSTAPGNPAATTPTAAEPTVTTTAPVAEPSERTLSSAAGSVRATCPTADTAQILSWTATKPYKVVDKDTAAGPSPAVTFKHGTQVTMTVTCSGGVPSATTT